MHNSFLVPTDVMRREAFSAFEFGDEIAKFLEETKQANGNYYIPMNLMKYVQIPVKFAGIV